MWNLVTTKSSKKASAWSGNSRRLVLGCSPLPAAPPPRRSQTACSSVSDFGSFWQILPNFGRLVLSCIDVSDSESRRIFQDFSKSTRSAFFCTAPNSKFSQNFGILLKYAQNLNFTKIAVIPQNFANFAEI